MEVYFNIIKSFPKIIFWKIKYRKKIKMPFIHSFGPGMNIRIKKGKIKLGKDILTRRNCTFRVEDGVLEIGNKCFFNENVQITCKEKIKIGNNVQIGPNVVIVDHDHSNLSKWNEYKTDEIIIGNNVWIGANSVILRGSVIGDNSIIGAGSIVKENIKENTIYYQKRENEKKNLI